MNFNKFLQLFVLVLGLSFTACKSTKVAQSAGGEFENVGYITLKTFNQYYYEGAKAKILGQNEEAISAFQKAINLIPGSHEVMYQLANLMFKEKRYDEAIHWAEKSIKKNPNYNHWYYGQLGQMYSVAKQYDKSAAIFSKMVEKDAARKSNYIEAGNQFLNAGELKNAAKYFEKYTDKFGAEEDVCRKLEAIYFDLGQTDKALLILTKLVESNLQSTKYLGLLAEAQTKANKISDAEKTYLKILELDPTNGFASFGMADVLRRQGKNDQSFEYLSKGFTDNRVNIQYKLKVISSYYFLILKDEKSKKQAFELCQKLIEAHPEDALGYQVYSDMLFAIEDFSEARTNLVKSLQIDGKDYRLWQKLFGLDVKLANNNFLYEDSKKALELFATQISLYIIHSQSALRVEKYDVAIETALRGLDISFNSDEKIQLYLTLADAWHEKGGNDQSDAYFEKAMDLDQNNALVLNNYAYNLYKRGVKLEKAETMIKKALEIEPESGSFADTYGCILMAKNELDEAEKWIKKSLELIGDNAEVLEHLADVYSKKGQMELAIETYKKALALEPSNKSVQNKLANIKVK